MKQHETYINNPNAPGQMGTVIDTKDISITKSAKEVISKAKRGGGSFAELMLTKHAEGGESSIAVMGFGKVYLGSIFEIGRECDISVLEDCHEEEIETPADFLQFVDSLG